MGMIRQANSKRQIEEEGDGWQPWQDGFEPR
jgi:hypothetical protein